MVTLEQITVRNKEFEKVVDKLDRYGICLVKKFLDPETLETLLAEHNKALSSSNENIQCEPYYNKEVEGTVGRAQLKSLKNTFPATFETFTSLLVNKVAEEYFKDVTFILNEDIFFSEEKKSGSEILPWHFDREQSLKFYFPLSGGLAGEGCLEFDPGSHREGHFRANYFLLAGKKVKDIPNLIPENELHSPIVVESEPGDLIVFDADGFHRAGPIKSSSQRIILRGHTHVFPRAGYQVSPWNMQWWLSSPINLAKWLVNKGTRQLAAGRLTQSVVHKQD